MALVLAERVKETSNNAAGTGGAFDLGGAVDSTFQTFVSGVGSGNDTIYCAIDASNWEVGKGVVSSGSPDTLSRTTIIDSSNGGSAVDWGGSDKLIFCTFAASESLVASNNLSDVASSSTALSNLGGLGASGGTVTGTLTIGTGGALSVASGASSFTSAKTLTVTAGDITASGGNVEVDRTGDAATARMRIYADATNVARYELFGGGTLRSYYQLDTAQDVLLVGKESDGTTNAAYIKLDTGTNVGEIRVWEEASSAAGERRVDAFPSGTSMWFFQATAPTGWSLNTTGAGDYALTSYSVGAGTFQGSNWTTSSSTGFASSGLAAHSHGVEVSTDLFDDTGTLSAVRAIGAPTFSGNTELTGSGDSHSHGFNYSTRPNKDARGRICDKD